MARARSRLYFCKAGKHRRKYSFISVEAVDDYLIQAKIDGQRETIVRRGPDPVRVRPFLAFLVRAGTRMLHESGGRAQAAVLMHGKRSDAAAIVIRNQNVRAGFVERDVTRPCASRGHLIQKFERAGLRINSKSAHRAVAAPIE